MKIRHALLLFVCGSLCCQLTHAQDIDKELQSLAEKLATPVKEHNMKKVTVSDFTDLQEGSSELGKYISEQLTLDLVMAKPDFAILDRANLRRILAEHKLTAQGLVDPNNAKKLGMFAGVDTLILGTIVPKGQNITLIVKIVTTETAEIIGAARGEFRIDVNVRALMSKPTAGSGGDEAAKIVKKLGDLRVDLQSLHPINGSGYQLTMSLVNQSPKRSLWVAARGGMFGGTQPILTNPQRVEFPNREISGIPATLYQNNGFTEATEIAPGSSVAVTMKFYPLYSSYQPSLGQCSIQMEFLVGNSFANGFGQCSVRSLVTKMEAD